MQFYNRIWLNGKLYTAANIHTFDQTEEWQKMIVSFLTIWFDETLTVSVDTSGSTGTPKKISLLKQSMINSALATNSFFSLDKNTNALLCLPASHIAGRMMLVRAIAGQFNLICTAPSKRPFETITSHIGFAAITPYQLSYSLDDIDKKQPEKVIVGGAGIPSSIVDAVQHFKTGFFETYGMTETCSHIAVRAVNGQNRTDLFKTMQNISVRLNGNECLCISAPTLLPTEIITNDIAILNDAHTFRIIGRIDNVINSGGIKIHPEIIEKKLENLISNPFFVSSLPDSHLGSKVVLVIEESAPDGSLLAQITDTLALRTEKYERPKEIRFVAKFSYSSNGKLLKKESLKNSTLLEE